MPLQDLTAPPPAPSRTMSNDEFIAKADAFVAWFSTFTSQMNTLSAQLEASAALINAAPAYADPGLMALAGNTPAANKLAYYNGTSTSALATFTAAARALLDDADAATMLSTLGLTANGKSLVTAADYAAMRVLLSLYTKAEVDSAISSGVAGGVVLAAPPGAVMSFAMNSAPGGWLKCNGAAVSRSTYAALFTAIGTTFGTGDGSTTFNVPELRGEFVRGWDDARGVDSGRAFGSTQTDDLKAHTHPLAQALPVYVGGKTHPDGGFTVSDVSSGTNATNSTGGTETRPRNVALLYCIKV